jgi:beta-lysine N6-acetyltransferase
MDLIADNLIRELGEDVIHSRETHAFNVGSVELVLDPYNRRLKLFDLAARDAADSPQIASCLLADSPNRLYGKIIVYARPGQDGLAKLGLRREAEIRGFFGNGDNAELWAKYPAASRAENPAESKNDEILKLAQSKQTVEPLLPAGFTCAPATETDARDIAALMQATFPDYPTPITPELIAENIRARTSHFRLVCDEAGKLAACASAEIHHTRKSAELTDCATRPQHRGKGLMSSILRALEQDLASEFGITDVYTIARANQAGMNCSFAKLGYENTGRLINNCRMPNGFESMNVWCRDAAGA